MLTRVRLAPLGRMLLRGKGAGQGRKTIASTLWSLLSFPSWSSTAIVASAPGVPIGSSGTGTAGLTSSPGSTSTKRTLRTWI